MTAPTAVKRRGGTTSTHSSFTGLNREVTVDDTKHTLVVHDGVTPGGFPLAKASDIPTVTGYAPLASPALTGNPTAPTQSAGNNSTRISTTAFVVDAITTAVNAAVSGLQNGVSATFDTLAELAAGLKNLGNLTLAAGDVLYASAANTLSNLAKGSDGQVLTLASGVPAWATPSSRIARNRIVNPAMQVSQENVNTSGTTNGYYAADQFATYRVTSAGTITSQRVQSLTPNGSKDRYRVTITVADASLAAGEYLTIVSNIEGQEVADLQFGAATAQQIVVRFGFKGPAGTYAVAINNSAANRSYVKLFTISGGQANTDTVQTVSIPGDTTGTWLTDTGIGLTLNITLASGSTFQTTANAWQAGQFFGTSGVSNGMGTGAAVYELFDVGLYADTNATGTAPTWEIPQYAAECLRCQRYLPAFRSAGTSDYIGTGQAISTTVAAFAIQLLVPPRAALTGFIVSSSAHLQVANAGGGSVAVVTAAWAAQSLVAPLITTTVASGLVAGNAVQLSFVNSSAYFLFTGARL